MVAITTRQTSGAGATNKGSPLTNTELDNNFLNLNAAITTLEAAPNFTGIPSAPTAVADAISGQLASTAFVQREKEVVSGKSQVMHQGTIVASCIDLPSKHSDGGAWIDRCQGLSWYNETLGGTAWLNTRCGSEAIARAVIQSAAMPELVTNGTFADGTTTGWTAANGATLSVVAGSIRVTNGATNYGAARQEVPVTSGKSYAITVSRNSGTGSGGWSVGTAIGDSDLVAGSTSTSAVVTATATGLLCFSMSVGGSTSGNYYDYDNISVKEVDTTVSAAGYVYQSTADNKFYSLTGSSGQSEVFRGIKREYPRAGVAWIAESARVVGYDLGSGAMWIVALATASSAWYGSAAPITSIAVNTGLLIAGGSGLKRLSFVEDYYGYHVTSGSGRLPNVSVRNAAGPYAPTVSTGAIVSNTVNSVAITSLPNAPIDPSTGLPVPTIAVATAGGVSVILDSGSVSSFANAGSNKVAFIPGTRFLVFNEFEWSSPADSISVRSIDAITTSLSRKYAKNTVPCTTNFLDDNSGANNGLAYANDVIAGANYVDGTYKHPGLFLLKENPTTPASGMVAYVTEKYNSGYQVGAIKGAYLADTTAETVTGVELVTNGDFSNGTTGWTPLNGNCAISSISGVLRISCLVSNSSTGASTSITTLVNKTYTFTGNFVADAATGNTFIYVGTSAGSSANLMVNLGSTTGPFAYTFVATSTVTYISFAYSSTTQAGEYIDFDNISVKLAEPDRSVKNKGLIVNGSLTKTAVASGAALVAYSGFSAANYLEAPYDSELDFGTGDFSVMGWVNPTLSSLQTILYRGDDAESAARILIEVTSGLLVNVYLQAAGSWSSVTAVSTAIPLSSYTHLCVYRSGTSVYIYANGVQVATATNSVNLTSTSAVTRIGRRTSAYNNPCVGSLALWRISATAPSADQISQIYRDELPLFQANAQCTLAGTSPAITALSFDEDTQVLHAATSYGRSSFKGLLRVESEATTVGSPTSIAASGGHIVMGGTSAKLYTPAKYLRDELQRQSEARKALGRIPVFLDFTATSGQTAFVATKGYEVKAVYANGLLKRITSDYTVGYDGYQYTVTMTSGIVLNVPVTLMLTRSI